MIGRRRAQNNPPPDIRIGSDGTGVAGKYCTGNRIACANNQIPSRTESERRPIWNGRCRSNRAVRRRMVQVRRTTSDVQLATAPSANGGKLAFPRGTVLP